MNIVMLHERVLYWCDRIASARFEPDNVDNALNDAIKELVEQKYDSSKIRGKGDSFQVTQKVRDELYTLVAENDTDTDLVLSGNLVTIDSINSLTDKYRYLLSASAVFTVSGTEYTLPLFPLTYNMMNMIPGNPHRRSRIGGISKVYYIESKNGILVVGPQGVTPDKVTIEYLAEPATVRKGIEIIGPFTDLEVVIVSSLTAMYGTVPFQIGDEITISAGYGLSLASGLAVHDYVNTDLPNVLHDELAIRAAINLLITAEMYDKVKVLESKILTS